MIETKDVILYYGDQEQRNYIQDLTAFGWQPTQEVTRNSGRLTHNYQILARETTMPHYNDYRRLENDYETAKGSFKSYTPMKASTVILLLLLLFIFPGVLYIVFKKNQKADIKRHNNQCVEKMQNAISKARKIMQESAL